MFKQLTKIVSGLLVLGAALGGCTQSFDPEQRAQEACTNLQEQIELAKREPITNDEERVVRLKELGEQIGQVKTFAAHELSQQAQYTYSVYQAWKDSISEDRPLGTQETLEQYAQATQAMVTTCERYEYMEVEDSSQK